MIMIGPVLLPVDEVGDALAGKPGNLAAFLLPTDLRFFFSLGRGGRRVGSGKNSKDIIPQNPSRMSRLIDLLAHFRPCVVRPAEVCETQVSGWQRLECGDVGFVSVRIELPASIGWLAIRRHEHASPAHCTSTTNAKS